MKRVFWALVIIAILSITSAILLCNDNIGMNPDNYLLHQPETRVIIDSGEYYQVYQEKATQIVYTIYNAAGEAVRSETTDRPLKIRMANSQIVDIGIGIGTGVTLHRYFDVEKNIFSQDYFYVVANYHELVAYIDVPEENSFEDRKIIIQNAFDTDGFYKEFQLDFAPIDTPVIQAEFSKDGTTLRISYLSGTEQIQNSAVLELYS